MVSTVGEEMLILHVAYEMLVFENITSTAAHIQCLFEQIAGYQIYSLKDKTMLHSAISAPMWVIGDNILTTYYIECSIVQNGCWNAFTNNTLFPTLTNTQ